MGSDSGHERTGVRGRTLVDRNDLSEGEVLQAHEILVSLEKRRGRKLNVAKLQKLGFSESCTEILSRVGAQEIASDFIVPSMDRLVASNTLVPFLPAGWICFAQSGSGDLWAIRREGPEEVAFVDHDQESRAKARPLGITLVQWVELAWFMREFDNQDDEDETPTIKKKRIQGARKFLESLARGLSKKYPYRL